MRLLDILKSALIWIFGAISVFKVRHLVTDYLRNRAIKKSSSQADKDIAASQEKLNNAEKQWVETGKEIDRKIDST